MENINEMLSAGGDDAIRQCAGELGKGVLFVLLTDLLWLFGIHGGNVMETVALAILRRWMRIPQPSYKDVCGQLCPDRGSGPRSASSLRCFCVRAPPRTAVWPGVRSRSASLT